MADHDLKVQRLGQMFTEIDASTLSMVLESHSGNVQAAAAFLLDAPPPPPAAARAMQQPQQPLQQPPPQQQEQDLGPQPAMQEYRIQTTLSKGWLEKQSGGKTGFAKKSMGDKVRDLPRSLAPLLGL